MSSLYQKNVDGFVRSIYSSMYFLHAAHGWAEFFIISISLVASSFGYYLPSDNRSSASDILLLAIYLGKFLLLF